MAAKLNRKAAGKTCDYQIHIGAPDFIPSGGRTNVKVMANIYNGLPSGDVKMRVGCTGKWVNMK